MPSNYYGNIESGSVNRHRYISVCRSIIVMKRQFTFGGQGILWIKSRGSMVIKRNLAFGGHGVL